MSILKSPRVHFTGTMSWDPGLANNNANIFDAQKVEVRLPPGQSNATFPKFLINNLARFRIWNLYGTHDAKFESNLPTAADNTRVVSARESSTGPLTISDPLLGKPLRLRGKLVDLDPEAVWNSQIYFDEFQLGDNTVGLTATRYKTMHSRWINFRRNLDRLESAGSAGVVWQTVFPLDHVRYTGAEQSPMLAALKAASEAPGAEGIMLRFATYRTLYYQNGIMNSQANRPRDNAELQRLHSEGKFFTNPAYSKLVGSIGVWNSGEPTSWSSGRYLVPSDTMPSLAVGGIPISLGPAVVEFDPDTDRLHLDFLHTIPEMNRSLDKPNLGNLTVVIRVGSELTQLGVLPPESYGRSAYEREAGIISIPLSVSAKLREKLDKGIFQVLGEVRGQHTVLLEEEPLVAVADKRDHYVNAGQSSQVSIQVFERGAAPRKPTRVMIGRCVGLQRTDDPEVVVTTDSDGVASFEIPPSESGTSDFAMKVISSAANPEDSGLAQELDITAGQFLSVRVLPTDVELEAGISDAELTWDLIYEKVLRNWDLVNPIMSLRGLPLNDETAVRDAKDRILEVINLANHESTAYMPITRDLSVGKRKLLERWLSLP